MGVGASSTPTVRFRKATPYWRSRRVVYIPARYSKNCGERHFLGIDEWKKNIASHAIGVGLNALQVTIFVVVKKIYTLFCRG